MTRLSNIQMFLPSGCLSFEASRAYLEGQLDIDQRSEVDAHLSHCDFCKDAVDGLLLAQESVDINSLVGSLNTALLKRSEERREDQGILFSFSRGTRWGWISAAASVVIIGLFSFYFLQLSKLPFNDVAEGYVPVQVALPDEFRLPEPRIQMENWYGEEVLDRAYKAKSEAPGQAHIEMDIKDEDVVAELDIAIVENAIEMKDSSPQNDDPPVIEAEKEEKSASAKSISTEEVAMIPAAKMERDGLQKFPVEQSKGEAVSSDMTTVNLNSSDLSQANFSDKVFNSKELFFMNTAPKPIFTVAERMPAFPGGKEAQDRYFLGAIRIPEDLRGALDTSFIVECVIDDLGRPRMIRPKDSFHKKLDREVLNAVRKMPDWIPGQQSGEKVSVRILIAVPIKNTKVPQ